MPSDGTTRATSARRAIASPVSACGSLRGSARRGAGPARRAAATARERHSARGVRGNPCQVQPTAGILRAPFVSRQPRPGRALSARSVRRSRNAANSGPEDRRTSAPSAAPPGSSGGSRPSAAPRAPPDRPLAGRAVLGAVACSADAVETVERGALRAPAALEARRAAERGDGDCAARGFGLPRGLGFPSRPPGAACERPPARRRRPNRESGDGSRPRARRRVRTCYLVDPASSHMLVSKIKPCMSKYKLLIL